MKKLIFGLGLGAAALAAVFTAGSLGFTGSVVAQDDSKKDVAGPDCVHPKAELKASDLVVSAPADASDVTVYGAQFAQVQETRKVANVPAGKARIQLNGIAAQYRADSLRLIKVSGPGAFTFGSATYQPANLTSERLLVDSVGKQVTAYRHSAKGLEPVTGNLQAVSGSQLVINVGGRTELVNTGDVSLVETPKGLTNTAALVVEGTFSAAGTYNFEFQYATNGLSWSAKHSLIYDEDNSKVESWATYVSVVNNSGVQFKNASVRLISGKVAAGVEDAPGRMYQESARFAAPMAASVASDGAAVESVGDQNVFVLPGTVDLNGGQSRLIPLFDAATYGKDVPVTKFYVVGTNFGYYGNGNNRQQQAGIRLVVENCEKHNLGKPLPAGSVEVQQRKNGKTLQLTGSTHLGEKATDEVFDLNIATSSEVKWELKLVQKKQVKGTVAVEEDPDAVAAPSITPVEGPARLSAAPVANAVFEEREYELVVHNYKRDKDVEVKVEINGALKSLPNGWKQVTADKNETTLKVKKSDKASVKFTTRTQIR